MIYIFRQYDSDKQIIIYAESYIEAKETLFEFNPWADKIYNILEYKMFHIDSSKFWDILNIKEDDNGYGYPRILSNKEYKLLKDNKIIFDSSFNNIHNIKVLTKSFTGENTNLLSTEEFINGLKNNTNIIDKHKQGVYQMLSIVGDIWFVEIFDKYAKFNLFDGKYIVYGKSRYQCKKFIEKLNELYHSNRFTSHNRPETLIENNYVDDLTPRDIERYNKMIEFMKANNIKKFPFTTYIEEES